MIKPRRLLPAAIALCTSLLTFALGILVLKGTPLAGHLLLPAAACAASAVMCAVIILSCRQKWLPQKLLLCLFLPLALLMLLAMPIGRVPDEDSHLQRIILLSEGQFFPGNDGILTEPEGVMDGISDTETTHADLERMKGDTLSNDRVSSSAGFNTGVYPPISYAPQAAAVALTRLFTSNRLAILYAARIGGMIATLVLLFAAVRLLPRGKFGFIAVCMMPMVLQEGMSASVDGMALGSVSLLTAWVLKHRMEGTRLEGKHILQLTLLCLLTVSCKMIYAPFVLLPLMLSASQWGSRGKKAAAIALAWGVTLLLSLGWLSACYLHYVAGQAMTEGASGLGTIVPQLQYMLTHPIGLAATIGRTVAFRLYSWLHTMLGSGLSALNITLPMVVLLTEAAALLLVWMLDSALPLRGLKGVRWMMPVCGALSVLVMLVALYAWWNPYQAAVIEGLQGRYLVPLVMPVMLAIRFRRTDQRSDSEALAPLMVMLCLPSAMAAILRAYASCL